MQNDGVLLLPWQPKNHDNQFQHSRLKIPRVFWNRTLNHHSIINVNKATKQKHEKC